MMNYTCEHEKTRIISRGKYCFAQVCGYFLVHERIEAAWDLNQWMLYLRGTHVGKHPFAGALCARCVELEGIKSGIYQAV